MANALVDNYKNRIGGGAGAAHSFVDLDTDTIKASLLDLALVTPNLATHQDYADWQAGVQNAALTTTLTLKTFGTVAAGRWDADNLVFANADGEQCEALFFWKDTGTPSTSPLICYFEQFTSGMPVDPNGGNINVTFPTSGILGF